MISYILSNYYAYILTYIVVKYISNGNMKFEFGKKYDRDKSVY